MDTVARREVLFSNPAPQGRHRDKLPHPLWARFRTARTRAAHTAATHTSTGPRSPTSNPGPVHGQGHPWSESHPFTNLPTFSIERKAPRRRDRVLGASARPSKVHLAIEGQKMMLDFDKAS